MCLDRPLDAKPARVGYKVVRRSPGKDGGYIPLICDKANKVYQLDGKWLDEKDFRAQGTETWDHLNWTSSSGTYLRGWHVCHRKRQALWARNRDRLFGHDTVVLRVAIKAPRAVGAQLGFGKTTVCGYMKVLSEV